MQWTLGELLAKWRKDAGLDQTQMAERVGVARNSISNYENGRSVPTFDVVARIAHVTGGSLDWLAQMCTPWDLNPEPTD
ncbi:helix-turn-helix domain-containing protein [Microbacterium allomyrinae]